jgi:hypothetical protein
VSTAAWAAVSSASNAADAFSFATFGPTTTQKSKWGGTAFRHFRIVAEVTARLSPTSNITTSRKSKRLAYASMPPRSSFAPM